MFMMKSILMLVSLLGADMADASSFLSRIQDTPTKDMSPELEASILGEIEKVSEIPEARVDRIAAMLRTTFLSMPKNQYGKLQHAAVRYTLHSYFLQRHAWNVRGLSDGFNGDVDKSSPTALLQDKVEEFVQGAFERRLGDQGLDLRDVAVLAATYENLIRSESSERLTHTFRVMDMSGAQEMSVEQVDKVLDVYMMGYVMGLNYSAINSTQLQTVLNRVHKVYPTWNQTSKFVRDIRAQSSLHRNFFQRAEVEDFITEVFDQYGHWQDQECRSLKSELLSLEDKSIGVNGSGRVRLTTFYKSALHSGNWQFSESKEYLEHLGALDVHDTALPRVMIPNYINAPSNCLASSKFYSVCCINECEDLMDKIEHRFAAPHASPIEITDFIATLPSSTVSAGRALQPILTTRLDDIARHHSGNVPLHGRLFAQWMHHAYPRECPYPHVAGFIRPQAPIDYMQQSKKKPQASKDEMTAFVAVEDANEDEEGRDEVTLWTDDEELYAGSNKEQMYASKTSTRLNAETSIVRPVVSMIMVSAVAFMLVNRLRAIGDSKAFSAAQTGGKDLFV